MRDSHAPRGNDFVLAIFLKAKHMCMKIIEERSKFADMFVRPKGCLHAQAIFAANFSLLTHAFEWTEIWIVCAKLYCIIL